LPPLLAAIDPAARLGIDLPSNCNLKENLTADSLQIAHRLIIDSIFRCGV